jgi:hypothetical protein
LLQWLPQAGGFGHGVPATLVGVAADVVVVDVEVVVELSDVAEVAEVVVDDVVVELSEVIVSVVAGGSSAGGVC